MPQQVEPNTDKHLAPSDDEANSATPTKEILTYRLDAAHVVIRRVALGLRVSMLPADDPVLAQPTTASNTAWTDEVFECSTSRVFGFVSSVQPAFASTGKVSPSTTLVPQADPPAIHVFDRTQARAFFTPGETARAFFLGSRPAYPFKDHQLEGMRWLQSRHAAILADDMGLGKTLQTIAAFEELQRSGSINSALVLCPKSLLGVWEAEIRLWAPRLCMVVFHTKVPSDCWTRASRQANIVLATYDSIRSERPSPTVFDLLILDEIHRLKSPTSLRFQSIYSLRPKRIWGLSGTPLENEGRDLATLLHLLDRKRVALSDGLLPPHSLRSLSGDYVLRRKKDVIASDLPDLVEKTELIPLSVEQKKTYDDVLARKQADSLDAWISTFNFLRGICDVDPNTGRSSKIDRAVEIVRAIAAIGEKVVVFSWRLEPLRLLSQQLARCQLSSALIVGDTAAFERQRTVDLYQSKSEITALLCSMRATGEGITLTAANHVLFINEWWNPAVNTQARDRVYRIGQQKTVYVYRLRTPRTVENRIDDILASKSALFNDVVNRLSGGRKFNPIEAAKRGRDLLIEDSPIDD